MLASAIPRLPLPSPGRLTDSLLEEPFANKHPPPHRTVLYLAYGSNLEYVTFQERRGIRPLAAVNVLCEELALTFDLSGIPYVEPCFGNVQRRDPSPGTGRVDFSTMFPPLHGVVYEVTASDYGHIIATEGGGYADVLVACTPIDTPRTTSEEAGILRTPFKAHTLLAPSSGRQSLDRGSQPSERYLNLIRTGAAEHSLPKAWREYLDTFKAFRITTLGQRIGKIVFVTSWAPWVIALITLRRFVPNGREGKLSWIVRHGMVIFKFMWLSHDWFFKPVFGDGEKTMASREVKERKKMA